MTSCVIALGKIGLPLAVQIASKGEPVIGADISELVVDLVNKGLEPFPGEKNLQDKLAIVVKDKQLQATTDIAEAVRLSENVVIVVPVVVDEDAKPDFESIDLATELMASSLQPGTLISYETTLPIGTTRKRFLPRIEEISGLQVGTDFFLAYSPERVFSGRIFEDLREYPKLVGGTDPNSLSRATAFYEKILDFNYRDDLDKPNGVWSLGSCEAAEMAKLVETTYRNVNIALANEFAMHAESIGIDIAPVIEASNSQPFSNVHNPGIAVGGHCIPVYPKFYLSTDVSASIPSASIIVNESMPKQAVKTLEENITAGILGKRIAILGAAYRGDVKETAFSGVFALVEEIQNLGGNPLVHDPLYTHKELAELGFIGYNLGDPCDAAILQADHSIYNDLTASDLPGAKVVYDGRRLFGEDQLDPIAVIRIGSGSK